MLRLLTLGGLTVESSEASSIGARARPQGLGLLARLAVAGERGLSRDKLVAYFWPERDERHALHSLSQTLHQLKRDLRDDAIVLGTMVLRLNPERISSDVGDLRDALRMGDVERSVRLYAGPFLDGIFLPGAPEFESWVEGERRRLADAHAECLRRLATGAAARGDHATAAQWWRRLLALDPLDGVVALELVGTLAAGGHRSAAVREARLHETLVRSELRIEPDAPLRQFIQEHDSARLRGGPLGDELAHAPSEIGAATTEELCARARQCLQHFTEQSFAEGVRYAEQAIQLDPRHSEAHIALAWLRIVLSQRDVGLRARGVEACRRALELDPGASGAWQALAWATQLDERFVEAEALALRGVELDPAGPFSDFVLAWVRLNYGLKTGRWAKCVESVTSFARSLERHPDPFALMPLSTLYTLAGRYEVARGLLERALDMERSPASDVRTVGTLTLLGLVHLHGGDLRAARSCLDQAMADYATAPQLFTPYINALSHCGLGDLERLQGRYDEAVAHYSRAHELLQPVPMLIGAGYVAVRLETRLAGAFRRLRMRREEQRHAEAARLITARRQPYSFNWCWATSEAELHYDWAVYHAACADRNGTVSCLKRAIDFGWREVALLRVEPSFGVVGGERELESIVREAQQRAALPDYSPSDHSPRPARSPSVVGA